MKSTPEQIEAAWINARKDIVEPNFPRVTIDQLKAEVIPMIEAAGKRINPSSIRRFTLKVARQHYRQKGPL
jgi:hypothetical protein